MPIETAQLRLVRFSGGEAGLIVELDSDPEVMRFLTGGAPTPRKAVEHDILPRMLRESGEPGFGFWKIVEKITGAFVGWVSFRRHGDRGAELGYRLKRAAWGRGYATEACRPVIERGFAELGIERVLANTYQDNASSRRVMEKLGMTLVRSYRFTLDDLRKAGTFDAAQNHLWDGDDVEYAITLDEWLMTGSRK